MCCNPFPPCSLSVVSILCSLVSLEANRMTAPTPGTLRHHLTISASFPEPMETVELFRERALEQNSVDPMCRYGHPVVHDSASNVHAVRYRTAS